MFQDQPIYTCKYCHYQWQPKEKVRISDKCPNCHREIGQIITIPKETWKPGIGAAVTFTILSIFIPIIPGIVSLLIALKTKNLAARVIAYLGVIINVLELTVILYALSR